MPVYNGEKYLKKAIESILNQTFRDFELIIINDGSTDKSISIINSYRDERIILLRNNKNSGVVIALNKGLEYARGKFIARLDCDDLCAPSRFKQQFNFLNNYKNICACGSWAKAIDAKGNFLFNMKSPTGYILKYNYWKPSPIISSTFMIRKSLLDNIRFEDSGINVEGVIAEDYDFWMRIIKSKKIIYNMKDFLISYRIHSGSVTQVKKNQIILSSYQSLCKNFNLDNVITLSEYKILCSMDYEKSTFYRLRAYLKLSKYINTPLWFMILDNISYSIKKNLFRICPGLRKF